MVQIEKMRREFTARLIEAAKDAGIPEWGLGARLAEMTGRTQKAASKWLNAESIPSRVNMEAIASGLGVRTPWLQYGELPRKRSSPALNEQSLHATADSKDGSPSKDDYVLIPQYTVKGDCGDGYLNDHVEVNGGLAFRRDWVKRTGANAENLYVIYAKGSSMEPYIFDGDVVMLDSSCLEPRDRKVYAIRRPNGEISIKRFIQQLSGNWMIRSDNPDKVNYPDEPVSEAALHELPIIGMVIWRGGSIG